MSIEETLKEKFIEAILFGYQEKHYDQSGNLSGVTARPALIAAMAEIVARQVLASDDFIERLWKVGNKSVFVGNVNKKVLELLDSMEYSDLPYELKKRVDSLLEEAKMDLVEVEVSVKVKEKEINNNGGTRR